MSDIVDNFNDEVNENSGCEIIVFATLRSLGFVASSPACDNGVADPTIRIRLFGSDFSKRQSNGSDYMFWFPLITRGINLVFFLDCVYF